MEYRWIENIREFQNIAESWDEALLLSGEDNPFLLSDFILTWLKYNAANSKLRVFIVFEKERIIGGIPLCQDRKGYLELPGGSAAGYTEFLSSKNNRDTICEAFLRNLTKRKDWRCVRIRRQRMNKINPEVIKSAKKDSALLIDIYENEYAYLIDVPENLLRFASGIPKKLRYYLRRSEKELSRLGRIHFLSLDSGESINEWCDNFIHFSRASFMQRGRKSVFENKSHCSFFVELINKFYKKGFLSAHCLCIDKRMIAVHFGYSIANNLNYLFPAFDIKLANLNPGHLLLYKLLEFASRNKKKIFDMYTGYRLYKEQWCSKKEKILLIEIRRNELLGKIESRLNKKLYSSHLLGRLKKTAFIRRCLGKQL